MTVPGVSQYTKFKYGLTVKQEYFFRNGIARVKFSKDTRL